MSVRNNGVGRARGSGDGDITVLFSLQTPQTVGENFSRSKTRKINWKEESLCWRRKCSATLVACLICTVRSIAKDGNFINESGGQRNLVNWSTRKEVYLFTNQQVFPLFEQPAFPHVAHVSRLSSLSV